MRAIITRSAAHNPYDNLALEELLLNTVAPDEAILYLWQNERTVVIGKNQDAYAEANLSALEADGGHLARRMSGGGAVYHDLGNVCYTFVTPKNLRDIPRQTGVALSAVNALIGGKAEMTGRNDLTVSGRKFSGAAWYNGQTASLHHGTLLVNTDFAAMSRYLTPGKQRSKGVASVSARVVNLAEIAGVSAEDVSAAFERAFQAEYGQASKRRVNAEDCAALREKYASPAWRLNAGKPKPDAERTARFGWGGVSLSLWLEGGVARDCRVYTDAMDAELFAGLPSLIIGRKPAEADLSAFGDMAADIRTLL